MSEKIRVTDGKRWTQQDISDAKALLRLHGNFTLVERDDCFSVKAFRFDNNWSSCAMCDMAILDGRCFPSLRSGEEARIDTILQKVYLEEERKRTIATQERKERMAGYDSNLVSWLKWIGVAIAELLIVPILYFLFR